MGGGGGGGGGWTVLQSKYNARFPAIIAGFVAHKVCFLRGMFSVLVADDARKEFSDAETASRDIEKEIRFVRCRGRLTPPKFLVLC